MSTEQKTPNWVTCSKCGHAWIGFYTPAPLSKCAKLLKAMKCPNCMTDSADIRLRLAENT